MKNPILDSTWGIFRYLFYRNDRSWDLLSENEKDIIRKAIKNYNNIRPDYFSPEKYNAGLSFDSDENRLNSWRGQYIQNVLETEKPQKILEIGPGSGYYTRQIVESPSVQHYSGVDINKHFLTFLEPRLESLSKKKVLDFKLMTIEKFQETLPKVDAIFLLSMVHHDPERVELFQRLSKCLLPGGVIVAIDPVHYIHRYKKLLCSSLKDGYLTRKYRENRNNLSTHHFCTLGEYEKICSKIPDLQITDYECFAHRFFVKKSLLFLKYLFGEKATKRLMKFPLLRALSTEIFVLLKKQQKP